MPRRCGKEMGSPMSWLMRVDVLLFLWGASPVETAFSSRSAACRGEGASPAPTAESSLIKMREDSLYFCNFFKFVDKF